MQPYSDAVRFHPWIGASYGYNSQWTLPLLILGESHYDTNGELLQVDSTQKVLTEYVQLRPKHLQYYTKVMNSVMGISAPSDELTRSHFWNSVAFYNYVQYIVPKGEPPTQDMWDRSRGAFHEVISKLKPFCILVVSTRLWQNINSHISLSSDFYVNNKIMKSGRIGNAHVGGIPHPTSSYGYKPLDWNPAITHLIKESAK